MTKKSEPISRIPRLEKKYQEETRLWLIILFLVVLVLLFFSFAQFAILDNFFKTTFDIPDRAKVFGIPSNNLLGFIATATLPITVLIDESNIISQKIKLFLPVIGNNFSTIWIVFIADLFLTALAFWESNQSRDFSLLLNLGTSFMIGASFSTFILYLTKGMTAVGKKANTAWQNSQIVSVYGIDPVPYGDDEKVRLSTEAEIAREQVRKLQEEIIEITSQYEQEIEILKDKILSYENYLGALVQLKENFHQFKELFQDLTPKSQAFFERFSVIEESLSNLIIPKFEIKEKTNKNIDIDRDSNPVAYKAPIETDLPDPDPLKVTPVNPSENSFAMVPHIKQPITTFDYHHLWQNLTLPSDTSALIISLLTAMEQQNFPVPNIGRYSPRNSLASCSFLQFDRYKITIYCRDENYGRGEKWNSSDELKFKCKLIQQTMRGYVTLHFTEQELITDVLSILEQIKSAIAMRTTMNINPDE